MRYGNCDKQHAEQTIKQAIRRWAQERESFDGVKRSPVEIEQIVSEQFAAVNDSEACNWLACFK